MSPLPLTLIAAVARNGVIGRNGTMPWVLPGDLAHFRAATIGKPVLMGRKTFDSIGAALPGRPVIVVTGRTGFAPANVVVVPTIETALVQADAIGRSLGAPDIMVAGGGAIYAALIGRATTLLLTEVDLAPAGDTIFPPLDAKLWDEAERMPALRQPGDEACYAFVRYRRRS